MTGDRTPLRERLAEALRKAAYVCPGDECPHDEDTCGANEPILLAASTVIDGIPEAMLIDGEVTAIVDAVLPVVEAETAALRERAEEAEAAVERVRALHNGGSPENSVLCVACCDVLPCPTLRALEPPKETPQ